MIHPTNRAQVIDDLLNLARLGYVDYAIALNGTRYLDKETNYLAWKAFFNGINFVKQRYQGRDGENLIEEYVHELAKDVYSNLSFVDSYQDSHFTELNRDLILSWMCKLNYTHCVDNSKKMFSAWRANNTFT